jgi:hypothetical protein
LHPVACTLPFWTLHAMPHSAPRTSPPCRAACSLAHVPSASGSDVILIGVRISKRTLCVVSTGLDIIIHQIPSLFRVSQPAGPNAASPLGAPQHDSIQASVSPTLHFRGITHRNLCLRFRGIEIRFIWPPLLCISISSISTARSHKSQHICHVHDGLDWPRSTRTRLVPS